MRLNPDETIELDCKDIKVSDFISQGSSTKVSHSFFFPPRSSLGFSTIINERVQLRHFNEKLFVCYFVFFLLLLLLVLLLLLMFPLKEILDFSETN